MERNRPCPVCSNWQRRPGQVPDDGGHHPECGVNLCRQQQARDDFRAWEQRYQSRRDDTGD